TIQGTARRICAARGVRPEGTDIVWGFDLPRLSEPNDLDDLRKNLSDAEIRVLIIDPLYLCLLSGNRDLQASNLFDMAPLLRTGPRPSWGVAGPPVLPHPCARPSTRPRAPLDLPDLAFAGTPEFARAWLLVNRREDYDPDTGDSKLWLSIGSSAGQSGL